MPHKIDNILYIHGFNSSPLSTKSLQTQQFLETFYPQVTFHCPALETSPELAIAQLEAIILSQPSQRWYLMGSSLGGYFASYLSEKFKLLALLVNPAVRPFDLFNDYLGEQRNPYTEQVYQVTKAHLQQLKSLYCQKISEKQYMVMVQTGDEVLDYQQAVDKYYNSQLIIQSGGDHSFVDYRQMLPTIMKFFKLA
jgi:hypothetical protein